MIRKDERGVTAPLEYVYTFAIAAILITGLIIAATNAAGDQRQRTVEAQMEVVAQQVAGSLEDVDRTIQSTEGGVSTLELEKDLPDELLGGSYTVTIGSGDNPTVTVASQLANDPVTTTATLEATSINTEQKVQGGTILVSYTTASAPNIEVTND